MRLRDGREVVVTAIEPRDARLLREFDLGLSDRSRRLRYLSWAPPLTRKWARRMASVDFRDRFAFVAMAGRGSSQRLVADCRLVPRPDGRTAEVAVAVPDDFQGLGLGRTLLELVLGVAADRGLDAVVAEVRYDNDPMMRLLRDLGFRRVAWELGVLTFVRRPAAPSSEGPSALAPPAPAPIACRPWDSTS